MMISIYTNSELTRVVTEDILLEGQTYFVDLQWHSHLAVNTWILEEELTAYVEYHPRNPILKLKFENIVGFVNILGRKVDVRSSKLLDGMAGNSQFKCLLEEIVSISTKLTFNVKGTSFAKRDSLLSYSNNDLETLDYYYQLAFSYPVHINLDSLLNQCYIHPNDTNNISYEKVSVAKSKRIPSKYFSQISSSKDYAPINESHRLNDTGLVRKIASKCGKRLFPTHVLNTRFERSYDTKENRFLKFFLEEINSICFKTIAGKMDGVIIGRAVRLQKKVHYHLQNPFFRPVSKMSYFPASSSVLLKKAGYREIYFHFIQSKLNFRPLVDEQKDILHNSKLKNIATLYEIWTFFKIAEILFATDTIQETFGGRTLSNGHLISSYTWRGEVYKLHFNKTYSRRGGESYSVAFRPDITLETQDGQLYLFDAKYKSQISGGSNDDFPERAVQSEDIHKMHAYIDAIENAKSSVVLYPGTEFIFYNKSGGISREPFDILASQGVGAIPLFPNQNTNMLNDFFVGLFRNEGQELSTEL